MNLYVFHSLGNTYVNIRFSFRTRCMHRCTRIKCCTHLYNERYNNNNNNNNKHFFNLQVANSPSRLRFEANLSRESSECTEHSQDQTSQINTGKTVYVGNA